jgi:type IV pilus assembly protein PilP
MSLDKETQQLKKKIEGQSPKQTILLLPKVIRSSYNSENLRDPFQAPATTQGTVDNIRAYKNFPLSIIRFIGIIVKGNVIWGIILTPDNHTYKIKMGDRIGNFNGKIEKITENQMEVTETIRDDQNRTSERTVIMPLK